MGKIMSTKELQTALKFCRIGEPAQAVSTLQKAVTIWPDYITSSHQTGNFMAHVQTGVDNPATIIADDLARILGVCGQDVSIEIDGDVMVVRSGRALYRLATIEEIIEPLANSDGQEIGTCDQAVLARAMKKIAHAVDAENGRYAFDSVCIDGEALVATDGRRLSYVILPEPLRTSEPLRVCPVVVNAVAAMQGSITLVEMGNYLGLSAPPLQCAIRLVEGIYPLWRKILPDDFQAKCNTVMHDVNDLLEVAQAACSVQCQQTHRMDIDMGTLDASGGISERQLLFGQKPSKPVSLNAIFLLEAVRGMDPGEVAVYWGGEGGQIVMEQENHCEILMPLQQGS